MPIWRAPSRSAKATRRSSPSTGRSSIAADGSASAAASRCSGDRQAVAQLAAQQQARELDGEVGLAPALLGRPRAPAPALGERAGGDGGDEEDRERDPVLALRDGEAPRRREVEEVEGGRARDGRDDAQPRLPERRHEQDGDEIDEAQRDGRGHIVEHVVDERHRGDRERRDREPQQP